MAPILVTGASGNVGREVVSCLRSAGAEPRLAGRHAGGEPESVRFDFTDPTSWQAAFEGIHTMFVVRHRRWATFGAISCPSLDDSRR